MYTICDWAAQSTVSQSFVHFVTNLYSWSPKMRVKWRRKNSRSILFFSNYVPELPKNRWFKIKMWKHLKKCNNNLCTRYGNLIGSYAYEFQYCFKGRDYPKAWTKWEHFKNKRVSRSLAVLWGCSACVWGCVCGGSQFPTKTVKITFSPGTTISLQR